MKLVDPRSAVFARLRGTAWLAVWASVATLAGCAGSSSPEHFFALRDGAAVIGTPRPSIDASRAPLPGIIVTAVTIPELVDRPQIVTRDANNRVVVSEQNLWAESIKSGVARTLAMRIARAMQDAGRTVEVAAYPQVSVREAVLKVTVDIVRFDAEPNGEAVVDALWSIRRPADDLVRTGHTVASSPISGTSYGAIVGAWNQSVEVIDRDIAAAVVGIGVDAPGVPVKR